MTSQPRPQGLLLFQYGDGKRKVFFPAAAILESEKTLGTRLMPCLFKDSKVKWRAEGEIVLKSLICYQ